MFNKDHLELGVVAGLGAGLAGIVGNLLSVDLGVVFFPVLCGGMAIAVKIVKDMIIKK